MPPNSPPLLYAATTGATPFRFNLHVGDLGHTLMIGPPGAGKSTFLGLAAAQWFRYPRAQVFAFDKGYSLFTLTQAADGEFYDIGGELTHWAFCPLRDIDTQGDVAWAVDWLESLCTLQDFKVSPRERNALGQAVTLLQRSPTRTLTALCANVQDTEVREALQYYTLGGTMGHLLDADEDMLGNGRFLTFETEHLMNMGEKAVVAVLLYLFRRIEKRLDGSPTLVPLDEAWVYLRHSLFRERVRDWLKTLRKLNGVVLLSTQNLSDIFNSPIRDVVLESCPTKVLLPNAEAANPASRQFYESIGLNEREISIVQTSIPKRQYYVTSPIGRRSIALGMGGVGLSFVGVNSREERQLVEDTITKYGRLAPPGSECVAWDWAAYLEEQLVLERHQMKPVIKRGAALLAMVAVAFTVDRQANAGVVGGFATEWTQLANNLQLINSYLRQGEQLTQEIRMVLDMTRNTAQLPSQVFGPITSDIASLARIVQGGRAIAYSMANLDAEFRNRFRGWGYNSGAWYLNYRDWSQTSLDTTLGALRAPVAGTATTERTGVLDRLPDYGAILGWPDAGASGANQIAEQQVQQIMKLRQLMLADLQSKQAFQAAQIQRQAARRIGIREILHIWRAHRDGRGYQAGNDVE